MFVYAAIGVVYREEAGDNLLMILSLTLNPALDVTGLVHTLIPNEKSYVFDEARFAGGNGINAGRIAHRLGEKVLLSGFLGGTTGEEIRQRLDAEALRHKFIQITGQTRMNLTVSLEKSHEQTRLSFPGPKIQKDEMKKLESLIKKADPNLLLIGGSLPPGVSTAKIKSMVKECHKNNIVSFVDIPGAHLKGVLSARPHFIKPNLLEFQEMTGSKVSKIKDVIKVARKFSHLVSVQCISSVEGGALLVTKDQAWFGRIPKVKIYSTVGAGDSMVGAMAHAYLQHGRSESLLRWGLAASCATLVNKGLTMGTKSSIKKYYRLIKVQEIFS